MPLLPPDCHAAAVKSILRQLQWIIWIAFAALAEWARTADSTTIRETGIKLEHKDDGLVIDQLQANKLIYRPGETGVIHVRIKNKSADVSCRGILDLSMTTELVDKTALSNPLSVTLAGGETKSLDVPFDVGKARFGHELNAILRSSMPQGGESHENGTKDEGIEDIAHDYFSVADNWFEVGIGPDWGANVHTAREDSATLPVKARSLYCNMLELGFWAPCDWSLLVSPIKRWWSGQASYPEDEDNLKALIKSCHERGIKVCFYANSNPAGPFAWELTRKHPEWFRKSPFGGFDGLYDVELLDKWNDESWRATYTPPKGQKLPWLTLKPDLRRLDALDWGIDQIVRSVKHYEWDAVRFDGHYSIAGFDDISTRNMRRLKEKVWKSCPDFRLGFNFGRSPEAWSLKHELREAMAGGGLYLQEGIRNWRYSLQGQYKSWQHYATTELQSAKEVQNFGGSYHCIWNLRGSPSQTLYKLVFGLIAGGHPYYGYGKTPGCDHWGAFMTRWSAFLWDINLKRAKDIEKMVTVDAPSSVYWEPLAQERVESAQRKYLILHLVNPPTSDEIEKTALPAPLNNVSLKLKPEPGTRVRNILLVRPEGELYGTEIQFTESNGVIVATVPRLTYWAMVIIELEGKFALPQMVPRFTEPADPVQVAAAEGAVITSKIVDPNKPEEKASINPNQTIWGTGSTFSGYNPKVVTDDEATDGLAQCREMHKSVYPFLGRPYLGPFFPGKYRADFHLKYAREAPAARFKLNANVNVGLEKSKTWKAFNAVINEAELRSGRSYKDYPLEFEIAGASAEYVTARLIPEVQEAGKDLICLDHILIEQLEQYPDTKIAELNKVEKSPSLRAPKGHEPQRVLLVRGLYWKQYNVDKFVPCTATYELPKKYEDIYANDVVVLCNVDFKSSGFESRKMLKDFVEDGGRLVILGGICTLGCGGMKGTYLEEMLPFVLKGPSEIVSSGLPLMLGSKKDVPYSDRPAVFWRHDIPLRQGAEVLSFAGPNPIAARRAMGKGSVVVFAGTVMGERADQTKPFWECSSWAKMLKKMIQQ
jgi:hypothetical protein